MFRLLLTGVLPLVTSGCLASSAHQGNATETMVWRPLGTWAGQGSVQTESFISDTGAMRVRWETRSERDAPRGGFRLTLQSAVSGRPIATAVDERGAGSGESLVAEDPRVYYALVESVDLDWRFSIEEGIVVRTTVAGQTAFPAGSSR